MRLFSVLLVLLACSCGEKEKGHTTHQITQHSHSSTNGFSRDTAYADIKKQINNKRKELATHYLQTIQRDLGKMNEQVTDCWVRSIGNDLYEHWAGTPWDFNGTTLIPKQGTIACGYFVTTLLLDMGLQINRTKLSTCAASKMMQKLVPHQPIKKLNGLTYNQFCDYLQNAGKSVYIIGLHYHVGFIVNDGQNCWFVHSNYINKQGVVKEPVQFSIALKASNTRWLISLTGDKDFIIRWLTAKT